MKAHIFQISAPLKEKARYLAERVNKAERLQRLLQLPEALWIDCGGFRRVTPTIFQFLDNHSRIMLAAGANPIFTHTFFINLFLMLALSAIFLNLLLSKHLVNSDHRLSEVAHEYGIRTIKSSCLKKGIGTGSGSIDTMNGKSKNVASLKSLMEEEFADVEGLFVI
ncbi:hypothetical protein HAX54_013860, partial [Datura stramonium]|nr:hypothetical protein [Datura stramonium]